MKILFLVCFLGFGFFTLTGQIEDFREIDLHRADSVALAYPNHSLKNLKTLAAKLTTPLPTDVEKFRAIYKWVCTNINYDIGLYNKILSHRGKIKDQQALKQWNKSMILIMYDILIKKHKTVCTGYAYLIRELSRNAGIPCEIIDGYGRQSNSNVGGEGIPSHQWNAVQLNSKWYLCDATWSCGSAMSPSGLRIKDFNEAYFLTDPELFVRNHYPLDTTWILLPRKPSLHEFLNRPIVYNRIFKLKTTSILPESFEIKAPKKMPLVFQFNAIGNPTLQNVSLTINGQPGTTFHALAPDSSGMFSVQLSFSNRGTYVVHVCEDNQNLFSYKVRVR